jgi:hypothetical protein
MIFLINQRVKIIDGSKTEGVITAVIPKKGFRQRYDYNEIYVTLDSGEKNVYNDWHIKVIDDEQEANPETDAGIHKRSSRKNSVPS